MRGDGVHRSPSRRKGRKRKERRGEGRGGREVVDVEMTWT